MIVGSNELTDVDEDWPELLLEVLVDVPGGLDDGDCDERASEFEALADVLGVMDAEDVEGLGVSFGALLVLLVVARSNCPV